MSFWCFIKHKWTPVKVFYTAITDDNNEIVATRDSWTGYRCKRCGEKKIKKTHSTQSAGVTQKAYNWLNEKETKQAQVLKLVK